MDCVRCQREVPNEAAYCPTCGAAQNTAAPETSTVRDFRRSRVDRQVAGVCGGIARYFNVDPVFVRLAAVVLTIGPGVIFFGVVAYLVAWLIVPEADVGVEPVAPTTDNGWRSRRLYRSRHDSQVGGVCGGIAEYFTVDPTAVRLLWVVLSIVPGVIVFGVLAYAVAWLIVPVAPLPVPSEPSPASSGGIP